MRNKFFIYNFLLILFVFTIVSAVNAAPLPSVSLDVPAQPFIGQNINFTATFDNTSATDTGYGPFIDLIFPVIGADGAGTQIDDGLDFIGASYLGVPLNAADIVVQTFPSTGSGCPSGLRPVNHPFAVNSSGTPLIVCGTPGNKLVTLRLPFGSFTPDQPPASLTINASLSNLADLNFPLTIKARAGFQFGANALNDPATDPTVLGPDSSLPLPDDTDINSNNWSVSATATPRLLSLTKTYNGPEDETATGPNYPRQYTITVNIAPGQTVTNLDITDELPENMQFISVVNTNPPAICGTQPSITTPGGNLICTFASVTNSASVTFSYYIPLFDSSNNRVIDPSTGDDVVSNNNAFAIGDWTPIDTRDAGGVDNAVADPAGFEHVLTDKSIAIQKSVVNVTDGTNSPNDVLEYTITFQISDYFAFDGITVTDIISDGQHFDSSFTPTMSVNGNPSPANDSIGNMNSLNYIVSCNYTGGPGPECTLNNPAADDGTTTVFFNVSGELISRIQPSRLVGGCINPSSGTEPPDCSTYNDGPTTVTIVFRTIIQEEYTDIPGDLSVDQGDSLNNSVKVEAEVLNNETLGNQDPVQLEDDGSSAGIKIPTGNVLKTIYAINGAACSPQPCTNVRVKPGDTVTYRIYYTLPTSDVEYLHFHDYLPLPIFYASEVTTFNDVIDATVPSAGHAKFGPSDTFRAYSGIVPIISGDTVSNSILFTYGDYDDTRNQSKIVDILFTVTVSTDPFADGLYLTNQVRAHEANSQNDSTEGDSIIQILLTEPKLNIRKGVVATNNSEGTYSPSGRLPSNITVSAPGSSCPRISGSGMPVNSSNLGTTFNSNLSNVDAGDLVTFAIVIENTGRSVDGAFDIKLRDTLPAGFSIPSGGLNLCITDGTGATINYTNIGSGLFDASGGIELEDPGPTDPSPGALDNGKDSNDGIITTGRNIAIITYDLQLDANVTPRQAITNTATLFNYSNREGGDNFIPDGLIDTATVTVRAPSMAKTITNVNPYGVGSSNHVSAGDTITYNIAITLPEGLTPGLVITDTLPAGFQYMDGSVTVVTGTFNGTVTTTPAVTPSSFSPPTRQTVQINFGDVTVTDDNDSSNNRFDVTLQALVMNNSVNDGTPAQNKTNDVSLNFTGNPGNAVTASVTTQFREPELRISKGITPANPDAGDTVTFTITVQNNGTSPVYDVTVTDDLSLNTISNLVDLSTIACGTTQCSFVCDYTNPVVIYTTSSPIASGTSCVLTFTATVRSDVVTGSTYQNTVSVTGDSQPGDIEEERDTIASGNANSSTASSSVSKEVYATSEDSTDPGDANKNSDPPVAIGEVITYRVTFNMPEGVTRNVTLSDTLPTGMSYVPGSSRIARVFDTNIQAQNNVGDINNSSSNTFVYLQDGTEVSVTGQVIRVSLGNITNSDNDLNAESYILEIKAVVENIASNNAGKTLSNKGTISYENFSGTSFNVDSNMVNIHIGEPLILVTKTANPITANGGDTITFTLTITNNSSQPYAASGFEWVITDTLPSDYEAPFNVTNIDTGTTGATVNASFTSNTLNGTIDRLDPGESITIEYTAKLKTDVSFGRVITNTANVTTTSLPGDYGTGNATPGNPGDSTGERTGSGGVNHLYSSDSADVTINIPSLKKEIVYLQNYYAVGETPTFRITMGVPTGITNNLVVTDILPSELGYVSGTLNVILPAGASSSNSPLNDSNATFFNLSGNTITLNFGTLTAPSGGSVTITYNTVVLNISSNQDGFYPSKNTVTITFDDPNNPGESLQVGPVLNDNQVRVGEPNLLMNKTITAGAVGSDAGDTVSWQVTIQNTGHTTAYQVNWQDILPDGLYQISNPGIASSGGNVFINGTTNAVGVSDIVISSSDADPLHLNNTIALPLFQIEAGATLTITYDSVLTEEVTPGEILSNNIRTSYTSIVDGGRDNSTDPGNVDDDDDKDLNNYEESASQSLTVNAEIAIDKAVNKITFTIGENVIYTIRIDVIEGVIQNLSVIDTLPDGLTYVSHNIAVGHIGLEFSNPGYNTPSFNGQEITFDFGNVSNASNGVTSDDFFTIEITAHVDNETGNQNGDILENNTYVLYGADVNDRTRVDFDYDAEQEEIQGLPINLVEPELNILKTVNPASQSLGDIVTYTITIQHTANSSADAYDLVITDVLPFDLSYVPGSASLPPSDVTVFDPQNLEFRISSLTLLSGTVSFTYRAQIDTNAVVGQPLTNDMRLTYKSITGANGNQDSGRTGDDGEGGSLNDYADSTYADVTPNAEAFIDAVKIVSDLNGGIVQTGDVLHYTITLHNTNGPVSGVVFIDTIPEHTTYISGSLSSTKGFVDDSGLPSLFVNIGSMASDEIVTITFNVTVNPGTQNGTIISNQGIVNSAQTVPEPTDVDGNDRNGDQPTDVVVGTEATGTNLRVEKYVAWLNDTDSSGSITPGDIMQYYIAFINNGGVNLTNLHFVDTIPTGLTYINGTASISAGTVNIVGNSVTADIPSLPAGQGENLIFNVTVNQAGTFQNQGTATADGEISTLSDGDGNPDNGEQPTVFVAIESENGSPDLQIQKTSELYQDNNHNGILNPGDTLRYTIYVRNTGSAPALNVRLTDPIPANTTLIAGSVVTSKGAIITENPVDINIGVINPGEIVTVQFRVILAQVLPTGTEIHNIVTVTASGDISTQAIKNDPVTSSPNFYDPQNVVKTVELSIDGINRYLTYTAVIISTGDAPAENVVFNDPVPSNTTYVPDTITLNGSPVSDAYPDLDGGFDNVNNRIVVNIGTLNPGVTVTITFRVLIDKYYSGTVSNQGILTGDNFPDEPTDDPGTDAPNDPTITDIQTIPTLNEWGIIIFIALAGIVSVLKLRRLHKV